jgi:HK97 family phage portal protein
MVLSQDAKWTPIQFSAADSMVLESRQWSAYEIARSFGIPGSCVGLLLYSNWNSIADESRALVLRCLRPFGKRIEAQLMTALLTPEARKAYYLEHDFSEMLAGDMKTRYEGYAIARNAGFLSVDDIRAKESMSKVPGGDTYMQPLNMSELGKQAATASMEPAQ